MSPAPTGAHPGPEEVDALLDPAGGDAGVSEHVGTCARCSRMRDGLVEVRALLRQESQRVPEPPADLGARITAALATATPPQSRSAPQGAGRRLAPGEGGTVVPLPARRRAGVRWLAAAAGAAVLAGSAAVAAQVVSGNPQDTTTSSEVAVAGSAPQDASGEAGAAPSALTPLGTGTDYEPAVLGDQVAGLLLASAARTAAAVDGGSAGDAGARPEAAPDAATDAATDQGEASLPPPAADRAEGDRTLADPTALEGCLHALGAVGSVPVAVDLARWEGTDAAVLVLRSRSPGASGGLEVWVVARDCGAARTGLLHVERLPS